MGSSKTPCWTAPPDGVGIPVPAPDDLGAVPYWFKFPITHTDLQAAALVNNIELYSMPAGGLIHGAKLKQSVTFAGVGITSYDISIGFAGELEALLPLYPVDVAPANDVFAIAHNFDSRNHGAAVSVRVNAISVGADLDQSTAGTADIWLCVSEVL